MKRMRFFAVIFTILISIVGSNFVVPEKVSAQATTTKYTLPTPTAYGNYLYDSTNLISYFDPGAVDFYNGYSPAQKAAYQEYFKEIKGLAMSKSQEFANDSYSVSAFQTQVLNAFRDRLNSQRSAITDPLLLKVNDNILNLTIQMQRKVGDDGITDAALIAAGGGYNESASELQSASNASVASTQQTGEIEGTNACINFTKLNLGACIDQFFAWIITHTLLSIAGWLLWITATVMNYSINVGILQFADWAPNTLYPIWLVVRQITSLFVVFAGLWLGFMYIIDKGDQFKKYIPTVVIFALFVNFSYPLTRTIIDVSNIISLNVYASTVGASTLEASTITVGADKTAGSLIMNKLGLIGIVDYATGDTKEGEGKLNSINSVGPALLAVVFILYAAWIFFIISALLVTRTAVLVFLIIASPLLFVDKIIPKLGEEATKLRGIFIEMLFVGPVFTIMLALTLKFLEVFKAGPLSSAGAIGSASGDSAITMFFNMLMMLIMLHIMFKVTKATSGKIGEAVAGVTGKVGGIAVGGAVFGGAGMLGRATLGRAAAAARDSKMVSGWMQSDSKMGQFAGKHMFNAANSIAKNGFDARNSAFVRTNAEKIGMRLGTGNSMGFEARAEKELKDKLMRNNFSNRAIKTKQSILREEYNSLDDKDKVAFLNKNVKDAEFRQTLEKETAEKNLDKALTKYKALDDDAEKEKFLKSQDVSVQDKLKKYDEKLAATAKEKTDQKKYQEDSLKAQQEIAAGFKNMARTSTTASVNGTQASNQAVVNNVALPGKLQTPAPTAGAVGYPANPKSALTIETPAEATARVASSQEAHVLDAVPF